MDTLDASRSVITNEVSLILDSRSENEALARMAVAAFIMELDPTMDELADVKTAVSEAVTNCVIHGYDQGPGKIYMNCRREGDVVTVEIIDHGVGIEDIEKAMEPLYTTRPELERSGMGFAFMEAFMDSLSVESTPGKGTRIIMEKIIGREAAMDEAL